ncbi:MAG TPA: hypothetical protein VKD71_10910 [Gemmataceae bacterium]|nr:hypothetical protein [Gemmataceae bacterium]
MKTHRAEVCPLPLAAACVPGDTHGMSTVRRWLAACLGLYATATLGWVLSRTLPGNPIAPVVVTIGFWLLLLVGLSVPFVVRVVRAMLAVYGEAARPLPPDGPEVDSYD